jgi:ABC-type transport system involved in multi-copper enzyme maturation permease subunit
LSTVRPLSEIRFVVERELRKNFRSVKGIVLMVLSLLGGSSIALLIAKYNAFKRDELGALDPAAIHDLREKALAKVYDVDTAKSLADSPEVLLALLVLTVWLTPMLVALMGFDSIAPDIQHRSVRYWTIRTRRWSYFVGKWFGLWATVSAVTFVMDAVIWIVCIVRGEATAGATLAWGLRFWLTSLPMSAVWCGIAILISSLFRSPIVALLLTFAGFFVLWVVYLTAAVSDTNALLYVYPNFYDHLLLNAHAYKVATGLGACLGMAALYVAGGSFIFAKRDV